MSAPDTDSKPGSPALSVSDSQSETPERGVFQPVTSRADFPGQETEIIRFWNQNQVFAKTLQQREGAPEFVFYEGPPTANGLPHPGHCLTRAIKDLFPRYRTMRGYHCRRKAGWDTHGLPVEVEVCKELGIHSKEQIEDYGVEPFIHKCQQSVWRYMQEWERLTERLGFWVNLQEAYVTYHQSYVESVWWALKTLFDRGLLYQGHKIVWWWAQGGTALSSGEVGQGYKDVADPSVYVRFPLLDEAGQPTNTSLLVWTTTPWTLPSNQFAAVSPELDYSVVTDPEVDGQLILASDLVEVIAGKVKRDLSVERTLPGTDLIGRRYLPPFQYYYQNLGKKQGDLNEGGQQPIAWRVVPADFVSAESGTGVVHQAPAFGEVDYEVLIREQQRFAPGQGPELICAVGPDGKFTHEAPDYQGRWVKEADRDIARRLREEGKLYHQEQYVHPYPFCWRAEDDPLIQYPRKSWFIRTTRFKKAMLENNQQINWLPNHIKDGRFGNFLESNVDWALSRERFWGTPLPIWQCEKTGQQEAIGSYAELLAKPGIGGTEFWQNAQASQPELAEDLRVHKPYIDEVTYDSPFAEGAKMRRVSEVIDCWFDSGAMPFAQWGYPYQNLHQFQTQFPADFISEAIDQTRGWFYSLVAISTLLFSEPTQAGEQSPANTSQDPTGQDIAAKFPLPFQTCIVLGLMLSEWWDPKDKADKRVFLTEEEARQAVGAKGYTHNIGKMSKSLRNYRTPQEIFDKYGADALRWYFFANQAPWTEIRYSETAILESIPEFLLRLYNVYRLFVIYANIDRFDPSAELAPTAPSKQESSQASSDDSAATAHDLQDLPAEKLAQASSYRPVEDRGELDRFILAELRQTACEVVQSMDAYDNYTACQRINRFVDVLSNWYVRRSRDRFWSPAQTEDAQALQSKIDAQWTLYECLVTLSKLIAPFVPFLAETLWQNLAVTPLGGRVRQSVHLCDYPTAQVEAQDQQLLKRMGVVLEIVSSGRAARNQAKLKVRQPLAKVEVILSSPEDQPWLEDHCALIAEELNVKAVEFAQEVERYISYTVKPDLKKLGPKLGKQLRAFQGELAKADPAKLLADFEANGQVSFDLNGEPVQIARDEVLVQLEAKPGWAASQGPSAVVVLSTELTEQLKKEGIARDLIHEVQNRRKELDCDYTDRIIIGLHTEDDLTRQAALDFQELICGETLADKLLLGNIPEAEAVEKKLHGQPAQLQIQVASPAQ